MKITRGTTPVIEAVIPKIVPIWDVQDIWMSIRQQENVVIHKTYENHEVSVSGQSCMMKLSQQDTLRLTPFQYATIGIRVLTRAGDAYASDISKNSSIQVLDVVKGGVIT